MTARDPLARVAGVPRASLVILLGTLASFNLPPEGVIVILGVDELMAAYLTGPTGAFLRLFSEYITPGQ